MFTRRKFKIGLLGAALMRNSPSRSQLALTESICFIYGSKVLPFTFPGVIYQAQQSCMQAFPNHRFTVLDDIDINENSKDRIREHFSLVNTKLVVVTSSTSRDIIESMVDEFPSIFFVISGGLDKPRPNCGGYTVRWYEQSYIMGYLLGLMTKDDHVALQNDGIRADHTTYSFVNGAAIGAWAAGKKLRVYRSDRTVINDQLLIEIMKADKPNTLMLLNDNGVRLNRSLTLFPSIRVAALPSEKSMRRIAPNNLVSFTGISLDSYFIRTVEKWVDKKILPIEETLGFDQNIHSFDFSTLIPPEVLHKVKARLLEVDAQGVDIIHPPLVMKNGSMFSKSISTATLKELKEMTIWDNVEIRFGEFNEGT